LHEGFVQRFHAGEPDQNSGESFEFDFAADGRERLSAVESAGIAGQALLELFSLVADGIADEDAQTPGGQADAQRHETDRE
jgi:hypothetical protein